MSYSRASSVGIEAGSLAEMASDPPRMQLGEPDRRCANGACGKRLTRLNREKLCFACQREQHEAFLRNPKRWEPVSAQDLMRGGERR